MNLNLPTFMTIGGRKWKIRTDFRDIIKIICAFNDPELDETEKTYVMLFILYPQLAFIPKGDYEEAIQKAVEFIDGGRIADSAKSYRLMDWDQDEQLIFPAVNRVAGYETRSAKYIHWWTFIGYYMEISDSIFSQVVSMRLKKSKGKQLEKWEQEYWDANKCICALKPKLTAEQKAAKDRLNAIL